MRRLLIRLCIALAAVALPMVFSMEPSQATEATNCYIPSGDGGADIIPDGSTYEVRHVISPTRVETDVFRCVAGKLVYLGTTCRGTSCPIDADEGWHPGGHAPLLD
jgi:hypothetical protein